MSTHRVVIVGGGFGGHQAARALASRGTRLITEPAHADARGRPGDFPDTAQDELAYARRGADAE